MADPWQLALLRRSVKKWNAWRKAHPEVRVDLSGANLSGANLDGANLDGANLDGANLDGAYLDGAYLYWAYLSGVYHGGATLSLADLGGKWEDTPPSKSTTP